MQYGLKISLPLPPYGDRQVSVGPHVAFGAVGRDGETYALVSAPSQEDLDAVAAALDAATPQEIREALATAEEAPHA